MQTSNIPSSKFYRKPFFLVGTIVIGLLSLFFVLNFYFLNGSLGPSYIEAASVTSVQSGNWSDPAIWNTGNVPSTGDTIAIKSGHTITYDVFSEAQLAGLDIEGTLVFSRTQNTRLKMDGSGTSGNIIVRSGGFLDMGTQSDSIPANVKAEIIFVVPAGKGFVGTPKSGQPAFDANDTGLWIMSGAKWESHGAPVKRAWVKLAQNAQAGANTLVVENDVTDWPVNGEVIITSSTMPRKYQQKSDSPNKDSNVTNPTMWQEEVRTIVSTQSLAGNQSRITLNQPLTYFHSGTKPMQVEVGLLTRNIKITTEVPGVTETELIADFSKRNFAHTMKMNGSQGNVMYTEFKFMGAFLTLGRYPIHLHQMEKTSNGMVIRGNSIVHSGHRWVVIHDTENVLVEDNVGYDSVQSGFMLERTPGLPKVDDKRVLGPKNNVFAHNLGVNVLKQKDGGIFWIEMLDNSFLGNVGTGAGVIGSNSPAQRAAGFISEDSNNTGWTRPIVSIKNEFHTNYGAGVRTWNNAIQSMDMVDTFVWRNGDTGIFWGAYGAPYHHYNARLFENGRSGVDITSIEVFLQDSHVKGGWNSGSLEEVGLLVGSYTAHAGPMNPIRLTRTIFENNRTVDIKQTEEVCRVSSVEHIPIVGGDGCSTVYVESLGSEFRSAKPLHFGHTPNKNSYWKFFDYVGAGGLPQDFVLNRNDQLNPANQAIITTDIINAQSYLDAAIDATVTPMSSLPVAGIQYAALERNDGSNALDYHFKTQPDYPPEVSLQVSTNGTAATMTAIATDDNAVTKVEFYLDENKVAEKTAPPYTHVVDLSQSGRKFAYLYAVAYDGNSNPIGAKRKRSRPTIAYSNVVEFGPEVVLAGQPIPSPTPIPTPTPTPTPIPTPTNPPVISKASPTSSSVTIEDGVSQTFTVNVSDADGDLSGVSWFIDGVIQENTIVSGSSGQASFSTSFSIGNSPLTIEAEVEDGAGDRTSTIWDVTVTQASTPPPPAPTPTPTPTPPPSSATQIPKQLDWVERGSVLSRGAVGSWEEADPHAITPCAVLKKDDTFFLYYVGARQGPRANDGGPAKDRALGVATSTDGINFTKYSGNPIITHQPHNNDEEGVFSCTAILDQNNDVVLYYGAIWATDQFTKKVNVFPTVARSTDGLHFTNHNYITQPGGEHSPLMSFLRADGTYHVYFTDDGGSWNLRHMESTGVSNFGSDARVLDGGNGQRIVGGNGGVFLDKDTIAMFVSREFDSGVLQIWTADVNSPRNLSLADTYDFGSNGRGHYAVFLDRDSSTWYMYYRAEQQTSDTVLRTAPAVTAVSPPPPSPTPTPTPTPTPPPPTPRVGDLDGDGKVNIADISILLSRFGKTDADSLQKADISSGLNNSSAGKIDIFDANKLMANWTG